jgi:uncharacterized protein (DUF1800 family)
MPRAPRSASQNPADSQNAQQNGEQNRKKRSGLNENYARELMELHTLGVDGGYTQRDVTEVARVFTGWTIKEPRLGGGFDFRERMHDPGDKTVLGQRVKQGGEKEGEKVLEMLARHPATARFIAKKLAMRFVADNPPPVLVDRMVQSFMKSDGDIREVLRTMFRSSEFWAPNAYRAKVKTPLEFVVSVVRATGAEVSTAMSLVQALNRMGMPLYGSQPPTGYSMKAENWVNSAALLDRMNFGLQFASGRTPGVKFDAQRLMSTQPPPSDAQGVLNVLELALLNGDVSPQTHQTIVKQLSDTQAAAGGGGSASPANVAASAIAGLILGSPEFQRR